MAEHVDPSGDAPETVRFGLDGIVHEVDLGAAEARALRIALAPYVAGARRTTVAITPIHEDPAPARPGTAPTGERAAARAWLEANGHRLGPGGRISATLMTRYRDRDGR